MEAMMAQDMTGLEEAPAGAETDIMFLTHMIPHHQAAIIETRAAVDGFDHRAAVAGWLLSARAAA